MIELYNHPSRHFTYVFNIFVFMQIFNFFNVRKIREEYNIFEGIGNNGFFLFNVAFIALV